MKMRKRLSILMIFCMLFSFSSYAFAETSEEIGPEQLVLKTILNGNVTEMVTAFNQTVEDSAAYQTDNNAIYFQNAKLGLPGWHYDGAKSFQYQKSDGTLAKEEWVCVSGAWYNFDESGQMRVGWYKERETGDVYFLDTTPNRGNAVTSIQNIDGFYYYFQTSGMLATDLELGNGLTCEEDGKIAVNGIVQVSSEKSSEQSAQGTSFATARDNYKSVVGGGTGVSKHDKETSISTEISTEALTEEPTSEEPTTEEQTTETPTTEEPTSEEPTTEDENSGYFYLPQSYDPENDAFTTEGEIMYDMANQALMGESTEIKFIVNTNPDELGVEVYQELDEEGGQSHSGYVGISDDGLVFITDAPKFMLPDPIGIDERYKQTFFNFLDYMGFTSLDLENVVAPVDNDGYVILNDFLTPELRSIKNVGDLTLNGQIKEMAFMFDTFLPESGVINLLDFDIAEGVNLEYAFLGSNVITIILGDLGLTEDSIVERWLYECKELEVIITDESTFNRLYDENSNSGLGWEDYTQTRYEQDPDLNEYHLKEENDSNLRLQEEIEESTTEQETVSKEETREETVEETVVETEEETEEKTEEETEEETEEKLESEKVNYELIPEDESGGVTGNANGSGSGSGSGSDSGGGNTPTSSAGGEGSDEDKKKFLEE